MYRMDPYYDSSAPIDLPTTMYKQDSFLKPALGSASGNIVLNGPIMLNGTCITIEELERRQDVILQRLHALRIEVDKLLASQSPSCSQLASAAAKVSSHSSCSSAVKKSPESVAAGKVALQKAGLSTASLVDMVLMADPSSPPLSVFVLYSKLCHKFSILPSSHVHSSASNSAKNVTDVLSRVFNNGNQMEADRSKYQLGLTVVWKSGIESPSLTVKSSNSTAIVGEGNIARYLARIAGCYDDSNDIVMATRIDDIIDVADQLLAAKNKTSLLATVAKQVEGSKKFLLGGDAASLADIVVWSALKQTTAAGTKQSQAVSSWLQQCSALPEFGLANKLV